MSEESFVYTACPGWGDHDYCALKTIEGWKNRADGANGLFGT